ncbi:hypothetical protein ColTof4_13027 [Colletotrichum tofieldiae]|uniref:Uncharacterized protein n=1 Tax=Colletotrichum tofieldiae TaxID=708197 RepID=A0A161W506_9PEZI|nr:hypothetical protein CT0861_04209 [Colletotrichum tofieldiae]GKT53001.1 hypothetical protein ColTof3_00340 [Colletotrichum tofieldiae]GKT80604.1 hypothetical protein ColTof4_13027 [Colletotrichum tofieldiae]GKT88732.1 hypothetical protein Ct61P_06582 [Colletotrichum tofieldiae]
MQLFTIVGASFMAVAFAALPPISLGSIGYPHGSRFVAWSPFTPTTTQELVEVCDTRGAIKGTATWTEIRVYETYVFDPICRNPFNITDDATNTTYRNLELACVDDNIPLYAMPEVTAVVDRTTNKTVETCVPVLKDDKEFRSLCSDNIVAISLGWVCSA